MAHCGFALVEVLVCALLLGLGAVGLSQGLRAAWAAEAGVADSGEAVARLGDLAESLRAVGAAGRADAVARWQAQWSDGGGRESRVVEVPTAAGVEGRQLEVAWRELSSAPSMRASLAVGLAP